MLPCIGGALGANHALPVRLHHANADGRALLRTIVADACILADGRSLTVQGSFGFFVCKAPLAITSIYWVELFTGALVIGDLVTNGRSLTTIAKGGHQLPRAFVSLTTRTT